MILRTRDIIEQIRRGNVPEGYQKTKDGIFPTDWRTQKMKQWVALAERPVTLEDDKRYRLVTVRRGFGGIDLRGEYLGKDILVKNYFEVRQGDFIISKRQIAHEACGVVPKSLDGAVVSNEYNVFVSNQGTNIEMFNLMMRLPHYTRLFYLMSDGVHIEKLLFKTQDWMKRKLAMPPIEEQRKIAAILTTQDKVIELKEKRLAEKQRQKKYLMQQLLTGKKRLPGFSGKWEKIKFKEIGEIVSGGTPNTSTLSYWNGNIPWCTPTDISKSGKYIYDTEKKLSKSGLDNSSAVLLPADSILMCSRASIGPRCINVKPMATNQGFKSIICNTQIANVSFVYDLLELCVPDFIKLSSGSTFLELSKKDFEQYQVTIPPLCEQNAIAEILSAADREVELLRQDIEQEKQKKKALMQLLLTGIVRVKI